LVAVTVGRLQGVDDPGLAVLQVVLPFTAQRGDRNSRDDAHRQRTGEHGDPLPQGGVAGPGPHRTVTVGTGTADEPLSTTNGVSRHVETFG
jgi:hypothetical protein